MTKDYRHYILEEIRTELTELDGIELPELTREFLGHFQKLEAHIEYPEYLFCEFPNGWQLILGFGDSSPDMWNGVLYWQLQRNYETTDYHAGQMNNGSPRFVLWSLFEQLTEQIDELGECDNCSANYEPSSRVGRCGDCGDCSKCCSHLKGANNA